MFWLRVLAFLVPIFVITALDVDSARARAFNFATTSGSETILPFKCHPLMAFLNLRRIESINGNIIWAQKIKIKSLQGTNVFYFDGTFEVERKGYRGTVWDFTEANPQIMKEYGFFITKKYFLRAPGTKKLNSILDSKIGTPYSRIFRFKDWYPNTESGESQEYTARDLLNNISVGKILLATDEPFFRHDRFEDHMVGILNMPDPVFLAFQAKVRTLFKVEEILKDNSYASHFIEEMQSELLRHWELLTGESGYSLARKNLSDELIESAAGSFFRLQSTAFLTKGNKPLLSVGGADQIDDITGYLVGKGVQLSNAETAEISLLKAQSSSTQIMTQAEAKNAIKTFLNR